MNCPKCQCELRIVAEQTGVDGNNLPVFHRIAYCDYCATKTDLDDPNNNTPTVEAPSYNQYNNDNECPICRRPFRFDTEQVGVDANNNPVFHRFAYCDTCKRKKDLDAPQGMPQNQTRAVPPVTAGTYNGNNIPNGPVKKEKKKDSVLSIIAAICALFGLTFWLGAILAIIDLVKGKHDGKRHLGSYFALIIAAVYVFVLSRDTNKPANNDTATVASSENAGEADSAGEDSTVDIESNSEQSTGVTGIEVEKSNSDPIEDFSYAVMDNRVILHSYKGRGPIVEVCNSYDIDGTTYETDVSSFQVGSSVAEAIIFDEGITEVPNAVFNMSEIKAVYFPQSMTVVYDNTLAYLHPEEGKTIKIYYAGTQEEWSQIFTEYKRQTVEEADTAAEKGAAVADKLNEMIGMGYNSSEFEYFFSASPDDLKTE